MIFCFKNVFGFLFFAPNKSSDSKSRAWKKELAKMCILSEGR